MDLQFFITILMSILVGAGATYIFMLGKLSSENKKWEEQNKNYFVVQLTIESRDYVIIYVHRKFYMTFLGWR